MTDAIAVITARGGSKGLPRKNVLPLAGRPLIAHTIRAAIDSDCFGAIVVTTDDEEIAAVSAAEGAEVLARPPELATDGASSLDVLRHALLARPGYARFGLLQPTSPLRSAQHLREAFRLLDEGHACTCVSITPLRHPPQKCLVRRGGRYVPLFDAHMLTAPRQTLEQAFRINGAIYLGHVAAFLASGDLFEEPLVCHELPELDAVDIDCAEDMQLAELLLQARGRSA